MVCWFLLSVLSSLIGMKSARFHGCWVLWVENIFTNVNAHKKLAFQR